MGWSGGLARAGSAFVLTVALVAVVEGDAAALAPPPECGVEVTSAAAMGLYAVTPRAVTSNGRFVLFDGMPFPPVAVQTYVRDVQSGITSMVSVTPAGQPAAGLSAGADISPDGRYVLFSSDAADLVAGDTNGALDLFVRDRQSGVTERVDVATGGGQAALTRNLPFSEPSPRLSADGRFVAFTSASGALVGGDSDGQDDLFVRDRQAGTTTLVEAAGSAVVKASLSPDLSRDGRWLSFVAYEQGPSGFSFRGVLRDLSNGSETTLASGQQPPVMSDDGRWFALYQYPSVVVWDRTTAATSVVSQNVPYLIPSNFGIRSISADGQLVSWAQYAQVSPGNNGLTAVIVGERGTNRAWRIAGDGGLGLLTGDGRIFTGASAGMRIDNVERPSVDLVTPFIVDAGTTATVRVYGTSFVVGTGFSFGAATTVQATSVVDGGTADVTVSVGASAAVGPRDVTVTNPDGCTTANPQRVAITAGSPVTRTYIGTDQFWTVPANWSPWGVPRPGDTLVLGTPGTSIGTLPDGTPTPIETLVFAGDHVVSAPIAPARPLTGSIRSPGGGAVGIDVPLELTAGQHTIDLAADRDGFAGVRVTAGFTGTGGFDKTGAGTLRLQAPSSFTGPINVTGGILSIEGQGTLGAGPAGTRVAGGMLALNAGTFPEPLELSGHGPTGAPAALSLGAVTLTGSITLAADTSIDGGSRGALVGPIGGSGGLTLRGTAGTSFEGFRVAGAADSTYNGTTTVDAGVVLFARSAGHVAVPGNLTIHGDAAAALDAPDQIVDTATVNVEAGGLLDLGGFDERVARLVTNDGAVFLGAPGRTGRLRTGSLQLVSGLLAITLDPTDADQVIVTGDTGLGGQLLPIAIEPVPAGRTFTIIDNDGTDPVTGRFVDGAGRPLADGAVLTAGASAVKLSYTGGDGNDVTLTTIEGNAGAFYTPVVPVRAFDTRTGLGTRAGPVGSGRVLTVNVIEAGLVPVGASAVTMNVTVTNPVAAGFVTVYPCDRERPVASNVNYTTDQTVPNMVTVAVPADGNVCFYTLSQTDLLADISGYYAEIGDLFTPVAPVRAFDTRTGLGTRAGPVGSGRVLTVNVIEAGLVPVGASAVTMNVTVTNPVAAGFVTVYPCDRERPVASNVNYTTDQTVPNMVTVAVPADGNVCFYTLSQTDLLADISGYYG